MNPTHLPELPKRRDWRIGCAGAGFIMRDCHLVAYRQAGFNPVVAMELLAEGTWQGTGVLTAESFDPDPYLAILDRDGIHHATIDIVPGGAFA